MKNHLKARNFGYNITQVLQVKLISEKNSSWHLRYLISNFFKIILNSTLNQNYDYLEINEDVLVLIKSNED